MIFQRVRTYNIVRQLEECLVSYQCTLEVEQITSILNRLKELNHHFGLNTIEELLDTYESINGAALELYDILFPPSPEEYLHLSRDRRHNILQLGII